MSPGRIAQMFTYLVMILIMTLLFGQLIALPVMIAVYLAWWGREKWTIVAAQAIAAWLVLYFMFGELMRTIWQPAYFSFF